MTEKYFDKLMRNMKKHGIVPIDGYVFNCAAGSYFITTCHVPIGGQRIMWKIEPVKASQIKIKFPKPIKKKGYTLSFGYLNSMKGKRDYKPRSRTFKVGKVKMFYGKGALDAVKNRV